MALNPLQASRCARSHQRIPPQHFRRAAGGPALPWLGVGPDGGPAFPGSRPDLGGTIQAHSPSGLQRRDCRVAEAGLTGSRRAAAGGSERHHAGAAPRRHATMQAGAVAEGGDAPARRAIVLWSRPMAAPVVAIRSGSHRPFHPQFPMPDPRPSPSAATGRGRWVAIITGALSILIGVLYLVLITVLDSRGPLLPPPPEALGGAVPPAAAAVVSPGAAAAAPPPGAGPSAGTAAADPPAG